MTTCLPSPTATQANAWLVTHGPRPERPRLRLVCFSYAGGSAGLYQPWRALLDADIELCAIQLPGRSSRIREAPVRDLPELVRQLCPLFVGEPSLPFAFFGHSLGALVAFELTRQLRLRQLRQPVKLIVSGASAPQQRSVVEALDEHDDALMVQALARYKGTPAAVLENRELMQLLAPALRADFAMAADYRYRPGPLLDLPLTVFAGLQDDHTPAQAEAWQLESRGPFALHWFDGDHFFLHGRQAEVLARLNAELSPTALPPSLPSPTFTSSRP